jgi:hypothetical protein
VIKIKVIEQVDYATNLFYNEITFETRLWIENSNISSISLLFRAFLFSLTQIYNFFSLFQSFLQKRFWFSLTFSWNCTTFYPTFFKASKLFKWNSPVATSAIVDKAIKNFAITPLFPVE